MKRLLLVSLIVFAFGALTLLPVSASPAPVAVEDLTALSAYLPAETLFFAAIRTDDEYIDTLDDAIDRIEDLFPGMIPPTGLRDQLNSLTKGFGGEFEDVIGSWLGDTAAFAIHDLDENALMYADMSNSLTLAVEIDDAEGVEAFIDRLIEDGSMEADKSTEGDTVRYDDPSGDSPLSILIMGDVMIVGQASGQLDRSARLSSNSEFTDALAGLPADDYNIAMYVDMGTYLDLTMDIWSMSMSSMSSNMPENPMLDLFDSIGESYGGAAVGFTVLDERSYVIDFSASFDMETYAESFGIDPALLTVTPIDPTFARHIPAGTPLVLQGANLGNAYTLFLAGMDYAAQAMAESMAEMGAEDVGRQMEQLTAQIEFAVRGATGLSLEEIFGWMTSDFALWFGVSPRLMDTTNPMNALAEGFPFDFALLVDAAPDPEAAAALVGGLEQAFDLLADQMGRSRDTDITVSTETIADTEAVSILITGRGVPFPVELVVASNDDVFVLGTRYAVEAALNPTNGLDTDPLFQEAMTYMLPDTATLAYASGAGFQPIIDVLESMGSQDDDVLLARGFLNLLHSSSVTQVMGENGTSASRFVITLPE